MTWPSTRHLHSDQGMTNSGKSYLVSRWKWNSRNILLFHFHQVTAPSDRYSVHHVVPRVRLFYSNLLDWVNWVNWTDCLQEPALELHSAELFLYPSESRPSLIVKYGMFFAHLERINFDMIQHFIGGILSRSERCHNLWLVTYDS